MRTLPSRLALAGLVAAVYGALALSPFHPYVARFDTHLIGNHGDALLQHLHCAWQWHALAEGRAGELLALPTLHPYRSGLAFGEPLLGICLPFTPVFLATGSSAAAFNSALIASFLLLGLATFLWARDLFASAPAGLLAAVLVLFDAWRVHYLSALNVLTLHYAILGLWLIGRWLRRARLVTLLGAALLFELQLLSAAQGAIAGSYLACVWLAVVWLGSGASIDPRRVRQLAAAAALFLALSVPWLHFFEQAFDAQSGLRQAGELRAYSESFAGMAHGFGVFGWRGALAALGAALLASAARRGRLPRARALDLLGIGCAALVLGVLARGPWTGAPDAPTPLPAYYAEGILPGLDLLRAPIRLAALTPLVLALFAAGGFARLVARLPERWGTRPALGLLLPLAFSAAWPSLDPAMGAPIAERPGDLALATRLAELPRDAVILSLPLALSDRFGAAVDERVLIHRRRQIGGFASIVPRVFVHAAYALGSWPREGNDVALALGATHVVAPEGFGRDADALEREGIRALATLSGRTLFALSAPPAAEAPHRALVPAAAATGRWLSLALFRAAARFDAQGYRELVAEWRARDGARDAVVAFAFADSVVGPRDPIRVHVPTPLRPGAYQLRVDFPGFPIEAEVEVSDRPTSFDSPVQEIAVRLPEPGAAPGRVRAGAALPLEVEIEARPGPILLATSRHRLPPRRGETFFAYGFRGRDGSVTARRALERSALAADLLPGAPRRERWYLQTPLEPGRYDLLVALGAIGGPREAPRWRVLLRDLEVASD